MLARNPIYDRISRLVDRIKSIGKSTPVGSQRPLSQRLSGAHGDSLISRYHDLEIPINGGLVRDAVRLRNLLEMRTYCPEIKKSIAIQRDDAFSSEHGDDLGISVSEWVDRENKIPIDPEVKYLIEDFIYSHFNAEFCKPILAESLSLGDSFCEIVYDLKSRKIDRLLRLPVGEMFRVEDDHGQLLRFEQRRYISDNTGGIAYHPQQIVHWRYQPQHLYGESLYEESVADWEDLKRGEIDLAKACRDLGVIPVQHEMAPEMDKDALDDYKADHQAAKKEFLITDLYTMSGVNIRRISTTAANLTPLVDRVLMRRRRLAMACRTPTYLLGIEETAAKQLSGQPASSYSRHIASVRQSFSTGVNQVLDLHLWLNGVPPDRWRYRLQYPKIVVNPFNLPAPQNSPDITP